jgi:hypothetical protein
LFDSCGWRILATEKVSLEGDFRHASALRPSAENAYFFRVSGDRPAARRPGPQLDKPLTTLDAGSDEYLGRR